MHFDFGCKISQSQLQLSLNINLIKNKIFIWNRGELYNISPGYQRPKVRLHFNFAIEKKS
jgi:hypothetical protein